MRTKTNSKNNSDRRLINGMILLAVAIACIAAIIVINKVLATA